MWHWVGSARWERGTTDSCFHSRHCPLSSVQELWGMPVSPEPLPGYHHHLVLPFRLARPTCPPRSCRACPVHWGGESSQSVIYCPSPALLLLCCCFSWPLKRNSTEVGLNHSLGQGHGGVLHELHQTHRPAPERVPGSARDTMTGTQSRGPRLLTGLTLADESLAGVQQNVTPLHDHPFNGEVFPDVFSVAHFVMHHSVRHMQRGWWWETWAEALAEREGWCLLTCSGLNVNGIHLDRERRLTSRLQPATA